MFSLDAALNSKQIHTFFLSPPSSATLASVIVGRVGTVGTPGMLGTVGTRAKASRFRDECTPGSMFNGAW